MARLPQPGSDADVWGTILNEYLEVSHNSDGTLKSISADLLTNGTTNKVYTAADQTTVNSLADVATSGSYADLTNTPNTANPIILIASDAPSEWDEAAGTHLDGSNDAAALETAINAGPVFLSPGTFTLNATITVDVENPQVMGSGWNSVIQIANGANSWAMTFDPPGDGVRGTFANFKIDGNSSNQTGGGGIRARGAVQSTFHNVHFSNCYDAGLWLDAFPSSAFGHHNKVVSCLFDADFASGGAGLGLRITSSDENYIRSEFQFLGGASASYAARDLAGLNLFHGSVFVGGRNNMGGIELRDGQRSRVMNCTFDGVSGHNIFVASSSAHVISGNVLTSVADQTTSNGTYSGIYLEFAAKECVITENVIETSSTAGRTRSLIREDGAGDTGINIVKHNVLRQTNAGTPSDDFTDMNGAGSLVEQNAINGTIV